jgi:hypothetical protein
MNWATAEPDDTPRRGSRRLLLGGIGLATLGALAAFLLWLSWQNEVGRKLRAIRERGEPVTLAELDDYYAAPPGDEDATALWLRGGAALAAVQGTALNQDLPYFGAKDAPLPGQPWENLNRAEQFLAANAESIRLLHDAAKLGGRGRFPGSLDAWGSGANAIHARLPQLRACGRVLMLEADVRAHEGDSRAAAEAVRTGVLLSQALENEPLLVSQLVRCALFGMAADRLKTLVPRVDFDDDSLVQLQKTLESVGFGDGFKRAMIGERVGGIALFENPAGVSLPGFPRLQIALFRPLRAVDEALYLDILAEYIAAGGEPWPQQLAAADAVGLRARARVTPKHLITSLVTPAFGSAVGAFARSETIRRLLIVAVSAERYRRRAGDPPGNLASLVPECLAEIPMDPTSGEPFRYALSGSGYVIYSPASRFVIATDAQADAETGANPLLLFRWPPVVEKPEARDAAEIADAPDDPEDAKGAAP